MVKKQLTVKFDKPFLQTVVNIVALKEIRIPMTVNER